MMISAKTPTAAKIAPMMIFVGFVSLAVDVGGVVDVRKVNWPMKGDQHAVITIGRVALTVSTSKPIPVLIIRTA